MILDKDIKLKVNSAYLQHLTDLGYRNIKMGEIITIPINHLKNGSHTEINVKCDICGRKKILSYRVYFKNIKRGNFYSCSNKCARKHINDNKKIIINNYNDFSYLIGLFQADGHLHDSVRNRGKFCLSLAKKDADIIYKIKNILDSMNVNCSISERVRKTNFGIADSIFITACELNFRNLIKKWGIPAGKKSEIIKPPLFIPELSISDYIRGLYDGDGSVGYTSNNLPYVSFVTQSEELKDFLVNFISEITIKPKKETKRNKRDDVYNIMITKEDAVFFCKEIYPENCLSIDRKYNNAQKVKKWKRPLCMRIRSVQKSWNREQDKFILSHSITESKNTLDRSEQSIKTRLWRLSKINKP